MKRATRLAASQALALDAHYAIDSRPQREGGAMGRWGASLIVRALGSTAVAAVLLAAPAGVAATVTGGCQVTGRSTSGGSIDLTTAPVWHLRSTDTVTVTATAPFEQFHGAAAAHALGLSVPLASGESSGETTYSSDSYPAATLAALGRVFVISGSSASAFHGCDGQVEIVLDDVNPLFTALGAAGIAGGIVGLLSLIWALRHPTSTRRRVVGLGAFALAGAGVALLLQQFSIPGEGGPGVSGWVASVAGPADVSLAALVVVEAGALSLLLVLLMPFPSELFNRTLEENAVRIRDGLSRIPLVGPLLGRAQDDAEALPGWGHPLAVLVVLLVGALLYGALDPGFGTSERSLIAFAGILLALLVSRWLSEAPRRVVQRSLTGDKGHLRALPGALLIAAGSVLISRLVNFEPGYLYGFIVSYAYLTEISAADEGRALAAGAWWMLGIAVVSWLLLGAVRAPGVEPTLAASIVTSLLAALVVAGVEGVVFGLVPLRFLHGEAVYRWKRSRWALLYGAGVFAFFWIILDPRNGFLGDPSQTAFLTTFALFVAFGLVSVVFWAYFRARSSAPAAHEHPV
jgi:hypothetical protein